MGSTIDHAPAAADAPAMGSDIEAMAGEAKGPFMSHMPQASMVATGIASGLAVSAITSTGRNLMSTLGKNPLVMFGVGVATGYFIHKYRKEIISTVNSAAEHSKDFVLRQREHIEDLLAESRCEAESLRLPESQETEEPDVSDSRP